MLYTADERGKLAEAYELWRSRRDALTIAMLRRVFANERAREFAVHGLCRRLATLQHCLDRTFESIPPEADRPARDASLDATAFIQTFMVNVYGAIDNLERIWCFN